MVFGRFLAMIIDRYIIKMFLAFFFGALVVVVTLFVAIDAMTNLLKLGAPVSALVAYYSYSIPQVIQQMLPVACLIATVFTLSSMNKANELTALFSTGMSLARISSPILAVVLVFSALSLGMSEWVLPSLNQKKNYTYFVEIKKQPGLYSTVKTNRIWYRAKNIILNIKTLNTDEATAQGATLYYFDDAWSLVQSIAAEAVKIDGRRWILQNGSVTLFQSESSFPLIQAFETKEIVMEPDTFDLSQGTSSSEVMSQAQLRQFIKRNKEAGLDTLRYEVDFHAKFSFAFAAFVMTLIGIPFCVKHTRQGGLASQMGIVFLLVFAYWTLYSSGLTLGNHGTLPPWLGAWGANVLMLGASGFFLLRLRS